MDLIDLLLIDFGVIHVNSKTAACCVFVFFFFFLKIKRRDRSRGPVYKDYWIFEGPEPSRPPVSLLLLRGPVSRWGPHRSGASPRTHGGTLAPHPCTPLRKQSSQRLDSFPPRRTHASAPANDAWGPKSLPHQAVGPGHAFFSPLKMRDWQAPLYCGAPHSSAQREREPRTTKAERRFGWSFFT